MPCHDPICFNILLNLNYPTADKASGTMKCRKILIRPNELERKEKKYSTQVLKKNI